MCYGRTAPLLLLWCVSSSHGAEEAVWWAANGHSYEVVPAWVTWWDAKEAAEAKGGYLATITSSSENAFVLEVAKRSMGNAGNAIFLGGYLPAGSADIRTGWEWITGELWGYNNWEPACRGEPAEPYWGDHHPETTEGGVRMFLDSDTGEWGSYTTGAADQDGYVIEYDNCNNPRNRRSTNRLAHGVRINMRRLSTDCVRVIEE